jgi:hypothetical protein
MAADWQIISRVSVLGHCLTPELPKFAGDKKTTARIIPVGNVPVLPPSINRVDRLCKLTNA